MVNIKRLTATRKPVEFASTHSGSDALLDEVGFQLCDAANDGQEQSANRAVRGDVLPPRNEFDSETVEFIHNRQKMPRTSCHTIKGGDNQNRKPSLSCIFQHCVKAGTTSF